MAQKSKIFRYTGIMALLIVLICIAFIIVFKSISDQQTTVKKVLEKQTESSGRDIEQFFVQFEEDLLYNISIGTFDFEYENSATENKHIMGIRRFYSKYQEMISEMELYNSEKSRKIVRIGENYFEISDITAKKNPVEVNLIGTIVEEETNIYAYIFPITNDKGEIVSNIKIKVDIVKLLKHFVKNIFIGEKSFYWIIQSDDKPLEIFSSVNHFQNGLLLEKGVNGIIDDIKNGYSGTISHDLTNQSKKVDVISAYYPVKAKNIKFGIVFSLERNEAMGKIESTIIYFTILFILITVCLILLFVYIFSDEKKRSKIVEIAQKKLLEMSEYRRAFLEQGAVGIILSYDNGNIEEASIRACEIFGYPFQELNKKNISIIFDSESTYSEFLKLKSSISKNLPKNGEMKFIKKDRTEIWCAIYGSVMETEDNEERVIWTFLDITDRKKSETELIMAKEKAEIANKTKSEFLANMSHEIRTPMNAILGFSELLEPQISTNLGKEYLRSIKSAGKNLLIIINDILDLSKIEAGKMVIRMVPFDVYVLAEEMKQMFDKSTRDKGISLRIETNSEVPKILTSDEVRLRQILINLIGNAVKFTEKGEIFVEIYCKAMDSNTGKLEIVFKVSDTGIGIDKEQIPEMFQPFRQQENQNTRKYGGTGLGLAISNRLADMINGKIEVESTKGRGSIFSLILKDVPYEKNNFAVIIKESIEEENKKIKLEIKKIDKREIEFLKDEFYKKWEEIFALMNNSDIENFGRELKIAAESRNIEAVISYADDLIDLAENFDIVNMEEKFKMFADFFQES